MATTRIMSMHINKGKTIAQCLKARLDYVKNPDKTEQGKLISAYACAPETADQEFLLNRNAYIAKTGRRIRNEVIAYQVRQSFQPGEVTPEEANKIGYELASRLLNGDFAFLVATHDDHAHIHNHIVFSAVSLDCARITSRDTIRMMIDSALRMQPDGFDALMQLLEEAGCRVKRGAQISVKPPSGKRFIRLDSLGSAYTAAALRNVLDGRQVHIPRIPRSQYTGRQIALLIDIEKKMREGKGRGYQVWAERHNLDAVSQSVIYLKENGINSYEELMRRIDSGTKRRNQLLTIKM